MYRFLLRPKWIVFHIVVLAAVVGMLGLARWQWNKHVEREDFTDMVEERQDAPAADLVQLLDDKTPQEIEFLRVAANGTYLAGNQLIEINRTQNGVNGVNVLTPFQIENGPIVLVNRGFVADGTSPPLPPQGTLRIGGTARLSEKRKTGELTDNESGATTDVRRVDLPLIEGRLGLTLAPVYIEFIGSEPAASEPPTPVPAPDLSGGPPHLSYTVQWLIFSICAIVGWIFAVRRSSRNQQSVAEKAAVIESVSPVEAVDAVAPAEAISVRSGASVSEPSSAADAVSEDGPAQPSA